MITHIAEFFLLFSHATIIVPLVFAGVIWVDRTIFLQVICLVLFSMILNIALKNTFQVPLAATLHKAGFAFPSGHMQTATVLYGWLALKFHNLYFRIFTIIVLTGIGMSLVYMGYHNYFDVAGAVFFAMILILCLTWIAKKKAKQLPWLLILMATVLMIYISLIAPLPWTIYFLLLGSAITTALLAQATSSKYHYK